MVETKLPINTNTLLAFLDAKPLFYDTIDYSRMPRIYKRIASSFAPVKIIHIIGTNGKGTTGRFLATALLESGYKVGHYSSPHIEHFNERIWLNGKSADDALLDEAHEKLQQILTSQESDALSYFEYTTLLAMLVYAACDYVVMEAGLGGEHDATAVFDKLLTLVTPIGMDHEAFLGHTIEDIAKTKLRAIQKNAILGLGQRDEVKDTAELVAYKNGCKLFKIEELLDQADFALIELIAQRLSLAEYLRNNLTLAISALKFLGVAYDISSFDNAKLFGRLSAIAPNVLVDVGHNPLAAEAIVKTLFGKKYVLVYNSYKDKDYKKILSILEPIILRVEILDVAQERIESREALQKALQSLGLEFREFSYDAFVISDEAYLVFGSFSVVERFLQLRGRCE